MADGGLLDTLQGIPEVAGNLLTGALAEPVALARQGWGQLMTGELPRESSDAADQVRQGLTYQPRTHWGTNALNSLGYGIDAINNAYIPGVTEASRSLTRAANAVGGDPYTGAGLLSAAGLLVGGPMDMEARALRGAGGLMERPGAFPQYAERYPPVPEPVLETDKNSGKQFMAKGSSPETDAFMKARAAAQKDIEAGNYTPYFDVGARFDADPSSYPATGDTLTDTLPKKQVTIDKHTMTIDTPEARARLQQAFDAGVSSGGHDRWYQMGQLQHAFMDELGTEEGLKQFKAKFADAMAATTGGADPRSNFLMAQYGNYLATHNMQIPDASYKMPVPIGGRYVTGNMEQYGNLLERGEIPVTNEKRHNFSRNFLGDAEPSTIDEQMTGIMTPGKNAPAAGQYGIYQAALAKVAKANGLDPRDFQDVAWGGKKFMDTGGKYQGKPMIQHVNEAIERTSRLTGLSPEDVVKRGIIRGEIPVYGLAGLSLGGGLLNFGGNDESL